MAWADPLSRCARNCAIPFRLGSVDQPSLFSLSLFTSPPFSHFSEKGREGERSTDPKRKRMAQFQAHRLSGSAQAIAEAQESWSELVGAMPPAHLDPEIYSCHQISLCD